MKVAHIVSKATTTAFSIDLAIAIHRYSPVDSYLVSVEPMDESAKRQLREQIDIRFSPVKSYRKLVNQVLTDGVDIVHTHHNQTGAYLSFALAATKSPLVHVNTQHGHIHYSVPQKAVNCVRLAHADALVYNSTATANSYNWLERQFIGQSAEFTVFNGVDMSVLDTYEAKIDECDHVVTAARLIPRKNLKRLIEAFVQLNGMSLTVVGDGPHRPELEAHARNVGVNDQVRFTGFLESRHEVYAELAKADMFALPSHSEGFGVSVVEAMAIGLPVVVSDIPVFHEVVGESGVFVDRMDPSAIADAIIALRCNHERARELGEQNQRRVAESLSLENSVNGYVDVYEAMARKHTITQ